MSRESKTILITNDDGFESKGLLALKEAMEEIANVVVVAPTLEKSACGHSLTLTRPLRFIELEHNFYKLDDGTPSDCVFLSLTKLFRGKKPDLVVSGINIGANLGEDITYSGTASAAMEAVLQGIPAIAFSQVYDKEYDDLENLDFSYAKEVAKELVNKYFTIGIPLDDRKFLNVNIPPPHIAKRELKVTYAGKRAYGFDAESHYNPRGQEYYWIGLPKVDWHPTHNPKHGLSDIEAIAKGYTSVTPIHLDMTHYESLEKVKNFLTSTKKE